MRAVAVIVGLIVMIAVGMCAAAGGNAIAKDVDVVCQPVEVVFANGSGEPTSEAKEYQEFDFQMGNYFRTYGYHSYRLGTEVYNGARYQPVAVGVSHLLNSAGAWISQGSEFAYGRSVQTGVTELEAYVNQRGAQCPNSHFVLAGYSQGAQVVGESLFRLAPGVRGQIASVALFGDPKLNLPEGRGLFPPCTRGVYSVWRRAIANCYVDNGSLGARDTYLPSDLAAKVGLWCNRDDFVCGSSKLPWEIGGHEKYANSGAAIDQAALEIYLKLSPILSAEMPDDSSTIPNDNTAPAYDSSHALVGHDYVFVIDPLGMNDEQLIAWREQIVQAASAYTDQGANVALATPYLGLDRSPSYAVLSDLQGGITGLERGLNQISAIDICQTVYGEQIPESITEIANQIDWNDGSQRQLIYWTGGVATMDDYLDCNRERDVVDPTLTFSAGTGQVMVSAISSYSSNRNDALREFVNDTRGVFTDNVPSIRPSSISLRPRLPLATILDPSIAGFIDQDLHRPSLQFLADSLAAAPGQTITFDVSCSAQRYADIVRYEWDFDNDGMVDQTTTQPLTTHAYAENYDGKAAVTAYTADDYSGSALVDVHVGPLAAPVVPQSPSQLHAEVLSTAGSTSRVMLTWQNPSERPSQYLLRINGYPSATLASDRTSLGVSDVERTDDVTFSLVGIDAQWNEGEPVTVTLPKLAATASNATTYQSGAPSSSDVVADSVADQPTDGTSAVVDTADLAPAPPVDTVGATRLRVEQRRRSFLVIGIALIAVIGAAIVGCWLWYRRRANVRGT